MKYIIAILASLAGPVTANACDPLGVCSQAVAVQQFAVQGHAVQVQQFAAPLAVQTYAAPVAVQSFAVQAFAVPQVFVQNSHCNVRAQRVVVQNVRQPRQVVRSRSVVRSR
jgi:hypothetical protein